MLRPHFVYLCLVFSFAATLFAQTTPAPDPQLGNRDAASQQAIDGCRQLRSSDRPCRRTRTFLHGANETVASPGRNLSPEFKGRQRPRHSRSQQRPLFPRPPGYEATARTIAPSPSPTTGGLGKRMLSKLSNVYTMKFSSVGLCADGRDG